MLAMGGYQIYHRLWVGNLPNRPFVLLREYPVKLPETYDVLRQMEEESDFNLSCYKDNAEQVGGTFYPVQVAVVARKHIQEVDVWYIAVDGNGERHAYRAMPRGYYDSRYPIYTSNRGVEVPIVAVNGRPKYWCRLVTHSGWYRFQRITWGWLEISRQYPFYLRSLWRSKDEKDWEFEERSLMALENRYFSSLEPQDVVKKGILPVDIGVGKVYYGGRLWDDSLEALAQGDGIPVRQDFPSPISRLNKGLREVDNNASLKRQAPLQFVGDELVWVTPNGNTYRFVSPRIEWGAKDTA